MPEKKSAYELLKEIMELGAPRSDAELVVDAIMSVRSANWINNEPLFSSEQLTEKLNTYMAANNYPITAKVAEVNSGKYIWEIKAKHKEEYFPPSF